MARKIVIFYLIFTVATFLGFLVAGLVSGASWGCPVCLKHHWTSTVRVVGTVNAAAWVPFYRNGEAGYNSPEVWTTGFECTRGHRWTFDAREIGREKPLLQAKGRKRPRPGGEQGWQNEGQPRHREGPAILIHPQPRRRGKPVPSAITPQDILEAVPA